MSLQVAEQIADAVLYEGYVLYPYRASAAKNRMRWQVGLVTPRAYSEATAADPWFVQTECVAEVGRDATLAVRVRCLHVQERTIEQPVDEAGTDWRAVESLQVDERRLISWDEAVATEFNRGGLLLDGTSRQWSFPWVLEEARDVECVHDSHSRLAARIVRRRKRVVARVCVEAEAGERLQKVRVRVENETPSHVSTLGERDAVLRESLAGTHTILVVENASFVSLLDPPASAAALVGSCVNTHTFPVLVGRSGSRDSMLSSPIILYDYPAVAPESPGDLCDATEIDEMLTLRVKTLTDLEKQEARATDRRAAEIIERCDVASADTMARLHGAIRRKEDALEAWEGFLNPPGDSSPEDSCVDIGGVRVARGIRVRLAPSHRADSMDICLRDRLATVTAVYRTLEDKPYVAVTLDDDPMKESGAAYRRALFFHPDELIPLDPSAGGAK